MAEHDDEEFLDRFESCTIPFSEWKHRAHLKVAYLYLRRFSLDEAVAKMRAGLKALNEVHGSPESLDRGYHETLTVAWMRLVHLTLAQYGPAESSEQFLERQPELTNRYALRFFYSRDRIMSWEAKREFVEPDLAPLPQPAGDRQSGG